MLFRRKVYKKLLYWKKMAAGSTAVLLEGARRIGKSTIIEEFAKNEYDDYLILDFALENQDIRENFRENLNDLDAFFRTLFLLKGKSLKGKRCAIIFDEVQLFPEARQAIKYLVKDGRYDYLETGSLISIRKNVQNILIPSEEYRIRMFPMDFEEYLWAIQDEITGPAIRDAFARRKPLGDKIHRVIMKKFRTYMAVGGMPQAVEALVEGKDFAQIDFILVNAGKNRVTDSLWLLVDFLEHKVFVATFFGSVDIPVDGDGLFFKRLAVNIAEASVLIGKADDFFIFHIINCPGILQDGGNVGGNEFSGIVYANDQRAVLAGGVDVMRMI